MPDDKYTSREAAAYLGIAEDTLQKHRKRGSGPEYLKIGKRVVYEKRSLDAYIDCRRVRSTAETQRLADAQG